MQSAGRTNHRGRRSSRENCRRCRVGSDAKGQPWLSGLVTAVETDPETDRMVATVERENEALRDELRKSRHARKKR